MKPANLEALLAAIRSGEVSVEDGLSQLSAAPVRDLGHTRLDRHRELRCGHPEVVYGAGKTPEQLVQIAVALVEDHGQLLITRATPEGARAVRAALPASVHHMNSGCVTIGLPAEEEGQGLVLVVCAGTSDLGVAEEAAITARLLGAHVQTINDVGVAGLHRLLDTTEQLRTARTIVVVAGMEGALPSVVGGLVECPVIAVPTSVGYGAAFGGIAALLGMLNSCAAGISVVNIDNGFGAGYQAALINRIPPVAARCAPHQKNKQPITHNG